jgi:hypothetical protein
VVEDCKVQVSGLYPLSAGQFSTADPLVPNIPKEGEWGIHSTRGFNTSGESATKGAYRPPGFCSNPEGPSLSFVAHRVVASVVSDERAVII